MIRLLRTAIGFVAPHAEFLVLLAVGAVAAFFYAQYHQVVVDRDRAVNAASVICARAGASFDPTATVMRDKRGKSRTVNYARGALCERHVSDLADFKAATIAASSQLLVDAMNDHNDRATTDAASAARDASAARAITQRMETQNARIDQTNRVDRDWFAAVNDVGGLRSDR